MDESPQLSKLRKLNFYETRGLVSLILAEDEKGSENESETLSPSASEYELREKLGNTEGETSDCSESTLNEDEDRQTCADSSLIDVKLVKSAEEFCKKNRIDPSRCKVFVGNISYKVRNRELREFFGHFGRVLHVQIVKDRVKKRSKGFGFVIFSNEYEADHAKSAEDYELMLDGRVMKVSTPEKRKRGRNNRFTDEEQSSAPSLQEAVADFEKSCLEKQLEEKELQQGPVTTLNDDTLLHIFSYLELKDRVGVERVCRRWRTVVLQSWQSVKHLDFNGVFVSFKGCGGLTDNILMSIFKRGCHQLKSLDVSASPRQLTDFSLHLIGKFCPGLTSLNLTGVAVTKSSFKCLAEKCPNLQNFKLLDSSAVGEKDLWWLLKCCRNLQDINLSGNKRLSGQCFFMLQECCQSLVLSECIKLTDAGLQLLARRCPNLKKLDLQGCFRITDEGLSAIFQSCVNLESLNLKRTFKHLTSNCLRGVENLTSLRELDLYKNCAVSDVVLYSVGKSCHALRVLNIGGCHEGVTDVGIQCIASNLLELEELNINNLEKITSSSVTYLAGIGSLKKLSMRGCVSVMDEGIIALVLECGNLQFLDLSGCINITNNLLSAISEVCSDEDHPPLELTVGGTSVTEEGISSLSESAPRCSINKTDLSKLVFDMEIYGDLSFEMEDEEELWQEEEDDDSYDDFEDGYKEFDLSASNEGDVNFNLPTSDEFVEDFLAADDPAMMADLEWS